MRRALMGALAAMGAFVVIGGAVLALNPLASQRLNLDSEVEWYRVSYTAPAELTLEPGAVSEIPVTVRNLSQLTWPAGGANPVVLRYRLRGTNGETALGEPPAYLPADLAPGEAAALLVVMSAPEQAGVYIVEWDMVEEGITWFSSKTGILGHTMLRVGTIPAAADPTPPAPTPTHLRPDRWQLWWLALRMAAERPLLGVGPDNFRRLYGAYAGAVIWDDTVHANNMYLEWLATLGVPGLLAFGWLAWRLAQAAYAGVAKRRAGEDGLHPIWGLAVAASLGAWFAHGLLDYFYPFTATYLAFWLIAGVVLAARQATRPAN